MHTLTFDVSSPAGIAVRDLYLTDMQRHPLPAAVRPLSGVFGGAVELSCAAPPPYIVRAHIGSWLGDLDVAIDGGGAGYEPGPSAPNLLIEAIGSRLKRCERRLQAAQLSAESFDALGGAYDAFVRGQLSSAFTQATIAGDDIEYRASLQALRARGRRARFSGSVCFGERLGAWSIGVGPDWPAGWPGPDFTRPEQERAGLLPLCEAMTLPNFWRWVEPERGQYCWAPLDEMLRWAEAHGIAVKSFSIFWLGIGGSPRWFRSLGYAQQLQAVAAWTRDLVERYRGSIGAWETVNEDHDWMFGNPFGWSREQRTEVAMLVNELVGTLDPGTPRVVNNCSIWGEYAARGEPRTSWLPGELPPAVDSPLSFTEHLIAQGVPFEGIGLQYYLPGRDLLECADQLERFIALGKEVWITEMGTPGTMEADGRVETGQVSTAAGWRGPWTEELQANWVRMWYTIAAARPQVQALNYWDLDDARSFIGGAGVIRLDGRRKPAFGAILSLRREFPLRAG
jgi:hypothetical protein